MFVFLTIIKILYFSPSRVPFLLLLFNEFIDVLLSIFLCFSLALTYMFFEIIYEFYVLNILEAEIIHEIIFSCFCLFFLSQQITELYNARPVVT